MPIEQPPSITAYDRALPLFADRLAEWRLCPRYLHAAPPRERMLFFHGDGGNGKSLLLKLLMQGYYRRLPAADWARLDAIGDDRACEGYDALARSAAESVAVPCVYHDLAMAATDQGARLGDALSRLQGESIDAAMRLPGAPPRLALLFDTHESFWGTGRHTESVASYFERDEWLRALVAQLYRPNHGVIVALAGREPPRWADALDCPILRELDLIDTQLIGHLDPPEPWARLRPTRQPLLCGPCAPIICRRIDIFYKLEYLPILTDVSEVIYECALADICIPATGPVGSHFFPLGFKLRWPSLGSSLQFLLL